jgi:hypothetical protein
MVLKEMEHFLATSYPIPSVTIHLVLKEESNNFSQRGLSYKQSNYGQHNILMYSSPPLSIYFGFPWFQLPDFNHSSKIFNGTFQK